MKKLLASGNVTASVTGGDEKAYASASAEFIIPLAMMRKMLGEGTLCTSASVEVSNLKGRKQLLLYKNLFDGWKHLTAEG